MRLATNVAPSELSTDGATLTWGCVRDANLPQAINCHRIRDSIALD